MDPRSAVVEHRPRSAVTVVAGLTRIVADDGPEVTFGRDPSCTVLLADERVSRRHAVLKRDGLVWTFTDLASSNGSFVNGARISSIRVDSDMTVHLGGLDGPEVRLSPIKEIAPPAKPKADRQRTFVAAVIAAIILAGLAFTSTQPQRNAPAAAVKLLPSDIVALGRAGTVYVSQPGGHGSGIYVGSGLVLTAAHVVAEAGTVNVSYGGRGVGTATIVGLDRNADLALLLVPAIDQSGAKALTLGDSASLKLGETIIAVGFPIDLGFTAKSGIVSGLPRDVGIDYVQTDATLNPGMSGGPLLNERGEVVGVIDFYLPKYAGLDFAVASSVARPFIDRNAPKR